MEFYAAKLVFESKLIAGDELLSVGAPQVLDNKTENTEISLSYKSRLTEDEELNKIEIPKNLNPKIENSDYASKLQEEISYNTNSSNLSDYKRQKDTLKDEIGD